MRMRGEKKGSDNLENGRLFRHTSPIRESVIPHSTVIFTIKFWETNILYADDISFISKSVIYIHSADLC